MKVYLLDNGTLMLDQSFATWNHGQGIGNALHEEMLFDRTGTLLNATLFEYHVPTIADMPDTFVSNIVENADGPGPYGAKGVGEPPTISSTGAVVAAIRQATGLPLTRIPVRPDDIALAPETARQA